MTMDGEDEGNVDLSKYTKHMSFLHCVFPHIYEVNPQKQMIRKNRNKHDSNRKLNK